MSLVRLLYFSENRLDKSSGPVLKALQGILGASKRNNLRRGLTGALVFDDLWFFQALEGEREAVWSTFTTIMDDPRHGAPMLVESVPIETRLFGAWSMRLATRNVESQHLFDDFMRGSAVRPELMSGADMTNILLKTARAAEPREASMAVAS